MFKKLREDTEERRRDYISRTPLMIAVENEKCVKKGCVKALIK